MAGFPLLAGLFKVSYASGNLSHLIAIDRTMLLHHSLQQIEAIVQFPINEMYLLSEAGNACLHIGKTFDDSVHEFGVIHMC